MWVKGLDRRAIYRMVKFYETYSSAEFVAALPPQIQGVDIQEDTRGCVVLLTHPLVKARKRLMLIEND